MTTDVDVSDMQTRQFVTPFGERFLCRHRLSWFLIDAVLALTHNPANAVWN